jgi:hypothetical protein
MHSIKCIDPRFLNHGTSWRWVVSFTPRSLYPLVPIGYEDGLAPEPVWTTWRNENSWPYRNSELRPVGRPARSQSLYRLCYSGSLDVNSNGYVKQLNSSGVGGVWRNSFQTNRDTWNGLNLSWLLLLPLHHRTVNSLSVKCFKAVAIMCLHHLPETRLSANSLLRQWQLCAPSARHQLSDISLTTFISVSFIRLAK